MNLPFKRKPLLWLFWLLGVPIMIIVMGICLVIYTEHLIEREIVDNQGEFGSVEVGLFSRSIQITNLKWRAKVDSGQANPHFLQLKSVSIKGISPLAFLINQSLRIKSLELDSGLVNYQQQVDSTQKKDFALPFDRVSIKRISFRDISLEMYADSTEIFSALINGELLQPRLELEKPDRPAYQLEGLDLELTQLSINRSAGKYGMAISRLYFNSDQKEIAIDSLIIEPNGPQKDARVRIYIPHMAVEGWQLAAMLDTGFVAATLKINAFEIYSYKDKRIFIVTSHHKPLPMEPFLKWPIKVKVDSILIEDGHILVEEISVVGRRSGKVTFENIDAELVGLNNRIGAEDKPFATLSASGFLMGKGRIDALFTLPQDGSPTYHAEGSIAQLAFEELNPALKNIAHLRVESGYLHRMDFDFHYTDLHSKGNISIDYQDLRLSVLNPSLSTNQFKTFMLNTLVRSRSSNNPSLPPTLGTIDIQRDRQKHIFNVWWKSIQDGLKSSILVSGGNGML